MTSTPQTTTSLVLESFGQPPTLQKTPTSSSAAPGTALLRILSTTVRPHNREGFTGKGPLPFGLPYIGGNSAAARVLAVGDDSVSLKPGQLVWVSGFVEARDDPETKVIVGLTDFGGDKPRKLFNSWNGYWQDVASAPLENCVPLNENILCGQMGYSFGDLEYLNRLSVANGGVHAADIRPGETVIVNPATGHFSGAVAELTAQLGCRTIALTRSAAKLRPITDRHPRIIPLEVKGDVDADTAAIRALCPGGVADAFIDVSPPEATAKHTSLTAGLGALRVGGRAVLLGAMGNVNVNYASLMLRGISIKGQWMYSRSQLVGLIKQIEAGIVKLGREAGHEVVDGGYELEDWERAVEVAEGATQWGRQVLFMP